MVTPFRVSDLTLLVLVLNQMLSSNINDKNVLVENQNYLIKLEEGIIEKHLGQTFNTENVFECLIYNYDTSLSSMRIQSIPINFDFTIEKHKIDNITIDRISIENKDPFIVGKYLIKYQEIQYHCFMYYHSSETKITFKKHQSREETVQPKMVNIDIEKVGTLKDISSHQQSVKTTNLDEYFNSLDDKYVYYNRQYFNDKLYSFSEEQLYSFQDESDASGEFVDQFGKSYVAFIPIDLFRLLEMQSTNSKDIKVLCDEYEDDGVPVIKIKKIKKE